MWKNIIAIVLICISGVLIVWNIVAQNSSFIGIKSVIKNQFKLFRKEKGQLIIVYGIPIAMAVGIVLLYCADKDLYQNIIVAVSVFVSMLFAMMSILTSKDTTIYKNEKIRQNVEQVLDETNNAIVFCVCFSVFEIILCLVAISVEESASDIVKCVVWGIIVYLFEVILLNMMIIVKRLSKIIKS